MFPHFFFELVILLSSFECETNILLFNQLVAFSLKVTLLGLVKKKINKKTY